MRLIAIRLVERCGNFDDVGDKMRNHFLLHGRIRKDSWVGVDLNQNRIELVIEHEVKAEDLEAAELAVKLVLHLSEKESADFVHPDEGVIDFRRLVAIGNEMLLKSLDRQNGGLLLSFVLRVMLLHRCVCQVSRFPFFSLQRILLLVIFK